MSNATLTIPVTILTIGTAPDAVEWSFARSMQYVIDNAQNAPEFNQNGAGIRMGARLIAAFDGKAVGTECAPRVEDLKVLHEVLQRTQPELLYPYPNLRRTHDEAGKPLADPEVIKLPPRMLAGYYGAVADAIGGDADSEPASVKPLHTEPNGIAKTSDSAAVT